MKYRRLATLALLAFGLLVMTPLSTLAQDRSGTAGSQYLLVTSTARMAALGSSATSGISGINGIEALSINPASLTLNTGTSALFSRMEYVADIGVNTFGVAQAIGNNQLAFSISSWDYGDIPVQTESNPEPGDVTYSAASLSAGLTYARLFTDRISAGVTFKLLNERIDEMNATGVAVDAGMTYVVGESGLRFGVSLKNFGRQLSYEGDDLGREVRIPGQSGDATTVTLNIESSPFELPSALNFGAAYSMNFAESTTLTVLGNYRSNAFSEDQFAGGLELGFLNILMVRGGYELEGDMDQTFYEGWNIGGGLNLDVSGTRVAVDYAYRATEFFDAVQMVTATVSL